MLEIVDFDFAFSFAGEDREIVEEIYKRLTAEGIKVFYDFAYQTQLVGHDLYHDLRELYKNKGRYIVCFISEYYTRKAWTSLEFTAIKERFMSTFFASDFLIPIIIGKAKLLEDIPGFIGFYTHHSIDETVKMLIEKINSSISENHLIVNVNNCIAYMCLQICQQLQANKINATLVNANELIIKWNNHVTTFFFSGDTVAQMPCMLITKGENGSSCKISGISPFPSYIITWEKSENLLFSIYEFDGNNDRSIKAQPLNEITKYFCSIIEKNMRG